MPSERQTFHCGAEVLPILREAWKPHDVDHTSNGFIEWAAPSPLPYGIDIYEEPDFPDHYFEVRAGSEVLLAGFIEAGNGSR